MNEANSEGKYNGWTNYETWVVKLWLDNEEPSYRYWTGEARRWKGQDGAVSGLAEQLKEELAEASPVNEPTLYGDLMNAALEEVNWLEIAESYLDEVPAEDEPDQGEDFCWMSVPNDKGERELVRLNPDTGPDKAEKPDTENPFGEVIFAYTRADALADGVLIDATETAKEAGFRLPVALTHAVWAEYVEVPEGVECQDEAGRLWDILWMCRYGIAQGDSRDASVVLFQLHVRNDNRAGDPPLVTLKAVCGPDDDAKPCITIMLPEEA
jgi:hypothetical protein